MSSLDERIVSLKFKDISQFRKDADTASTSMENLNKTLDSTGKGFSGSLNSGINIVGDTISSLTNKFSVLGTVATGALLNIGAKLENTITSTVKSLTVDNVAAGWDKYQTKVANVQTLMSQGFSEEQVTSQLEKLMWYTDETSYSFTDMVRNISKFTGAGVGLEEATTAMIGISNWAALSGQGIAGAERTMYNLAQALSSGVVKNIDWMSVINANMSTVEVKQNILDTAVAYGTLTKAGDKYVTSQGTVLDANYNFRESLSDSWFTSEVLIDTLSKYGNFTEEVYKYVQENGGTASEAIAALSGSTDELGKKALKAAQEALTFKQALEATTEASQSAFSTSFEIIFGTYNEAKVLWTDLANALYDLFVEPLNEINESLAAWKEAGGRTQLFEAIYDVLGKISNIIDKLGIKNLFDTLFPKSAEDIMWGITKAFQKFSEVLTFSTPDLNKFKKTAFEAVDQLEDSGLTEAENPLMRIVNNFAKGIEGFRKGIEIIKNGISALIKKIKEFLGPIIPKLIEKASEIFQFLGEGFYAVVDKVSKWIQGVKMGDVDLSFLGRIWEFLKSIWEFLKTGVIDNLAGQLKNIFGALGDSLDFDTVNAGGTAIMVVQVVKVLKALGSILNGDIANQLKDGPALFGKKGLITETFQGIKDTIFGATDKMAENNKIDQLVNNIKTIAMAILMMAVAVLILAAVDSGKAMTAIFEIGLLMQMLATMLKTLSTVTNTTDEDGKTGTSTKKMLGLLSVAAALVIVVGAIALLAGVVVLLSFINPKKLLTAIGVVAIMMVLMGLFAVMASKMNAKDIAKVTSLATAMVIFASSLIVFSIALGVLSLINMTKALESLLSALVASGIIALICLILKKQVGNMTAIASAMIIFSAAIAVFAVSLGLLKLVGNFEDIVLLMAGLSVAMLAFAALATFLQPSIGAMTALATVIMLISAAAILLSLALFTVITAISAVAVISTTSITYVRNLLLYGFKSLLIGFAKIIGEAAPMLIDSLFVIIAQFLNTLAVRIPQIAQSIINILIAIVKWIADNVVLLVKAFKMLIFALLKVLNELILKTLADFIGDNPLGNWIRGLYEDADEALSKAIDDLDVKPIEQTIVYNADTSALDEKEETIKNHYKNLKTPLPTLYSDNFSGGNYSFLSDENSRKLDEIKDEIKAKENGPQEQTIDQSSNVTVENMSVNVTTNDPDYKTIRDATIDGLTKYANRKTVLSGKNTLKPALIR